MATIVDARGLPCPQPVILTRNAMQQVLNAGEPVTAIVDNETAQQNVTRMAEKRGATVLSESREGGIYLYISGGQAPDEADIVRTTSPPGGKSVMVAPSEFMGRGEHDELGHILMRGFFHTLGEVQPLPNTIILLNSGVKLVVQDSPVLEDLRALSGRGIEILACGTCLGYYGLREQVAVGEISNMYTIAETMLCAERIINL